jgi:hypothetical protein
MWVFALARIMGHSSITITLRYVHTQSEAVEQAFQILVTEGGQPQNSLPEAESETITVSVKRVKG